MRSETLTMVSALGVVVLAAVLARGWPGRVVAPGGRFLESARAPLVFGALTALGVAWAWGSLRQLPWVHDEKAYLLQASMFAAGHWTSPAPPLPEFFEQMAVLVTPVFAAKMPPGHALLLAPGLWIGLPGLVSVLLSGVAGGLVFALARRVSNAWVALLAWIVWFSAPDNLAWRSSYFSEMTTSAACLMAWWALLAWREERRLGWLLTLAACIGWGLITRPLLLAIVAVPIGVVVARAYLARPAPRDLAWAFALGAAILALVPLWSARTTGDWRTTPLTVYTRTYLPFDALGFGFDDTSPLRPLPQDLDQAVEVFRDIHRTHTVERLPAILWQRLARICRGTWAGWRYGLWPLAVLGLIGLPAEVAFALATAALVILAHLLYAHVAGWTVYYLELQPLPALLTALGAWRLIARITREHVSPAAPRAAFAVSLLVLPAVVASVGDVRHARAAKWESLAHERAFRALLDGVPAAHGIVFVRYAPDHDVHRSLVANEADLGRARLWLVQDRGAENEQLMRLAPERTPYLLDEGAKKMTPLRRPPA